MNVAVTGASGFVGARLVDELLKAGHTLHAIGRRRSTGLPPAVQFSEWPSAQSEPPAASLATADAIVHLAGEPVAQRWTPEVKERIRSSRVDGTRNMVNALARQARRPQVLVSASAIGYYGSRGDEILNEDASPGEDFLARVTVDWEAEATKAERLGIRVVRLRIGMVLGEGGALAKMLPPFRLGLGGRLASGRHWISWIHIDDVIGLIKFALENPAVQGPVNTTAPHPATNAGFTKELAAALHRPAIFPVPPLALKIMFGEMADVLLGSQRVLPKAAQNAGFQFRHPELEAALVRLLSK